MTVRDKIRAAGFTLVEIIFAVAITAIVIGASLSSFVHGLRIWHEEGVVQELNMDLQVAMENIRKDLRLSSAGAGQMAFYPVNSAAYTAISFPMAEDLNNDGLLDRDSKGKIIWNKTIIYHVRPGSPQQLLRTVYSPRYTNATPANLYTQLAKVAQSMTSADLATAAMTGESVTSRAIFKNLVDLKFRPPAALYDCYSATTEKGSTYNWGSIVLEPGFHTLNFTVVGKNSSSTGYKIGIDKVSLSPSSSSLEGELFTPINIRPVYPHFIHSVTGGTVSAEQKGSGWVWGENAQLTFNATGPGSTLNLLMYNDLWNDTAFRDIPSQIASNCSVKIEPTFAATAPYINDVTVSEDKGIAWTASSVGSPVDEVEYTTPTKFRNILYGGSNNADFTISREGCYARLVFESATGATFYVKNVKIVDAKDEDNYAEIKFPGGASECQIAKMVTSLWTEVAWETKMEKDQNYYVDFETKKIDSNVTNRPAAWQPATDAKMCQINNSDTYLNRLIAVQSLEVGYPKRAIYRSNLYDTRLVAPQYQTLRWTQVQNWPAGKLDVRLRTCNNADMSDVTDADWSGVYAGNTYNIISTLPKRRYIQYEAIFECNKNGTTPWAHTNSPPDAILRDITIAWKGQLGLVDVLVDFGRGPDGGIVTATVDGKPFSKGIYVEMAISKAGVDGTDTASGTMEVTPLNTGK